MKITAEQRAQALTVASHLAAGSVCELRASGKAMAPADRDALLAKAVAREYVELELDVLAYEQGRRDANGKRITNRNGVRFRDGAMMRLGSSGAGRPFLRDHMQGDVTARSGTVLTSKTSKLTEDGHYEIRQTVRLTEPSAVERALRGLMSTVSIGWNPTGPVNCTACGTEILTRCFHFPGDDALDKGGAPIEVEWEFTSADLVETSELSVPGVPTASIEGFRAALALATKNGTRGPEPQKANRMTKLCTMLGLAATAGDDEITDAVGKALGAREVAEAKLAIAETERAKLALEIDGYRATERKNAEDEFVGGALASGRILPTDEPAWRRLYAADKLGAVEEMGKRAAGCAAPVGVPPQREKAAPSEAAPGAAVLSARQKKMIADLGMTEQQYADNLKKGGKI